MIELLKQVWAQLPILIKLKELCDQISESLPYLKTLALIAAIGGIPPTIMNMPKIIRKIEHWFRFRR